MPNFENAELRRAIQDLYYWQRRPESSNFASMLYTLFSKADIQNKARLEIAFPIHHHAFVLWQTAPDEQSFFDHWLGGDIMRLHSR